MTTLQTQMRDTSLDAFHDLKLGNTLQLQQKRILNVMQPNRTYTRRELAALAGMETSSASARINSLLDTHIAVVGTKKDAFTKKTVEALMLISA